jgi:hypothetical protein
MSELITRVWPASEIGEMDNNTNMQLLVYYILLGLPCSLQYHLQLNGSNIAAKAEEKDSLPLAKTLRYKSSHQITEIVYNSEIGGAVLKETERLDSSGGDE